MLKVGCAIWGYVFYVHHLGVALQTKILLTLFRTHFNLWTLYNELHDIFPFGPTAEKSCTWYICSSVTNESIFLSIVSSSIMQLLTLFASYATAVFYIWIYAISWYVFSILVSGIRVCMLYVRVSIEQSNLINDYIRTNQKWLIHTHKPNWFNAKFANAKTVVRV